MAVISDSAIAAAARNAGLSGDAVAVAVAIALAESGGDTNSHNSVPPDNSYGLWQINMLGSMGPERRKLFDITNNEALYAPNVNAKAMFILSNGGKNWKPWTTYTRGTYLGFMARGRAAANSGGTSTSSDSGLNLTPTGLSDSLGGITSLLQTLQTRAFWVRAGIMLAGAGIAFYGLGKISGLQSTAWSVTKAGAEAAIGLVPGGGTVTKVVKGAAKVVK